MTAVKKKSKSSKKRPSTLPSISSECEKEKDQSRSSLKKKKKKTKHTLNETDIEPIQTNDSELHPVLKKKKKKARRSMNTTEKDVISVPTNEDTEPHVASLSKKRKKKAKHNSNENITKLSSNNSNHDNKKQQPMSPSMKSKEKSDHSRKEKDIQPLSSNKPIEQDLTTDNKEKKRKKSKRPKKSDDYVQLALKKHCEQLISPETSDSEDSESDCDNFGDGDFSENSFGSDDEAVDGLESRLHENFSDPEDDFDNEQFSTTKQSNSQIQKFKNALGITDLELQKAKDLEKKKMEAKYETKQVQTLGLLKRKAPSKFLVFDEPGKKSKKPPKKVEKKSRSQVDDSQSDSDDEAGPAFDMHRARFEVRKFGVRGLEGKDKEQGMVDLLVRLGAKPPKSEHKNYKELQIQKKQEQEQQKLKRALDRSLGFKVINPNNRKRTGRNKMSGVDGQIGSYRGGVQVVGKKDIAKVMRKKGGRR